MAVGLIGLGAVSNVSATTIDFGDAPQFMPIGNYYPGVTFSDSFSGYMGGASTAFSPKKDGTITFNSLVSGSFDLMSPRTSVVIETFLSSSLVKSITYNYEDNISNWGWANITFSGINKISFINASSMPIYVDNLTFNPATAATPVPAAVWLFGSGLAGLIATRRKNSR